MAGRNGRGLPRMGMLLLAATLGTATTVHAQDCTELTRERSRINRDMAELVETYPGTHVVIGICGAAAAQTYEETKNADTASSNFGACAVIGCAIAGFENCANVTVKWFGLALRGSDLETRLQRYRC